MIGRLRRQKNFWLLGLCFLLVACSTGSSDLDRYLKKVRERKPSPIEPIPTVQKTPGFAYHASDLRSPFQTRVELVTSAQPDLNRPKEPLESYALDALKLVGTLKQSNQYWALVLTPDGRIQKVTLGNYIGQNYGQIIEIRKRDMKIEETVQGKKGWEKRINSIVVTTQSQSAGKSA